MAPRRAEPLRTPRDAALALAARGWSVIPIEPRGKRPLAAWHEFHQRRAGADEIAAWFARWPDANVGIVTGAVSQLVVLDIDASHGGLQSLAALEAEHGALPPTVEAVTGGGERHLYFARQAPALRNRAGLRPGIDLRAEGGSVVAPPSLHPSGRRYAWAPGGAPDQTPPAPLPRWLFDCTRTAHAGHGLAHWRNLVRAGVPEGERNSTLASLTGHLLWHGVDAQVALELLLAWNRMRCRPPLPDDEVAQVVQSIARLHERECSRSIGGSTGSAGTRSSGTPSSFSATTIVCSVASCACRLRASRSIPQTASRSRRSQRTDRHTTCRCTACARSGATAN